MTKEDMQRRFTTFTGCLSLCTLLAVACWQPAVATPGELDPAFGRHGRTTTGMGGAHDVARAMAIQPDGRIVVAGAASEGSARRFALARYLPDGSTDVSFGREGSVLTSLSSNDLATAIALQSDGRIVAAGRANGRIAVARYLENGDLDTSFSDDGRLVSGLGTGSNEPTALALQGDGKILVAGTVFDAANTDFALLRFHADGSPDLTFGAEGVTTTDLSDSWDYVSSLLAQPDGSIVVAGDSSAGCAVVRFAADGSLDPAFGAGGKTITSLGGIGCRVLGVARQADGGLVLAGSIWGADSTDFLVARFDANGVLDATFGAGGKVVTPVGLQNDLAYAIQVLPGGDLLAAGETQRGDVRDFALVRYSSGGVLVDTFTGGGVVTTDFAGYDDFAMALAVQQDGKLLLAGGATLASNLDFALARYTADGTLDGAFGAGGMVTTALGSLEDRGRAVAIQPDGKIVLAGVAEYRPLPFNNVMAIARFAPDGRRDPAFDGDGRVVVRFPGSSQASAVAVQPDGKLLLAGDAYDGCVFALARLQSGGALDPEFGADGRLMTTFDQNCAAGTAMVLQPDGKIVVAGYAYNSTSNYDMAVVRYLPDGTLDGTFGGDGRQTVDFAGGDDRGYAVALQPDGKIVVAGKARNGGTDDAAILRLEANGEPDAAFGAGGKIMAAAGDGLDAAYAVAVQDDGGILVAGESIQAAGKAFLLLRRMTGGLPDNTFGEDGTQIVAFDATPAAARTLVLEPDGGALVGGFAGTGAAQDFALVRVLANGSLDAGFGSGGKVMTDFDGGYDQGWTIARQPDGGIVFGGAAAEGGDLEFALARYRPTRQRLMVAREGSGRVTSEPQGIDCGAACTADFAADAVVVLTAAPEAGFAFGGWSGDCRDAGACHVTLSSARHVTATFVPELHTLSVGRSEGGRVASKPEGIDCGTDCVEEFSHGTAVLLAAVPEPGYRFDGWTGACVGTEPCLITLGAAMHVMATFHLDDTEPGGTNQSEFLFLPSISH